MKMAIEPVQICYSRGHIAEAANGQRGVQEQFEVRVFAGGICNIGSHVVVSSDPLPHPFNPPDLPDQRPYHDAATWRAQLDPP